MRWFRGLIPLLLLTGIVTGCTGTTENVPPLLLAIGRQDPTNASAYQMVLVEDNYTANQSTTRALTVVPNSARPLAYPAVASDVVDRTGTRSTMVVLTRQLSGTNASTSPVSFLRFFNLQGIDPTSPSAFQEQSSRAIELTGTTGDPFYNSGACFTSVQISYDGRYAALLSSPQACDPASGNPPALYVLDTQSPTTHYQIAAPNPLLDVTPFDDQAQLGEQLYFLVQGGAVGGASNAELYSFEVPYDPTVQPADAQLSLPGIDQTTLTSNGSQLVALTNPDPYTTPSYQASFVQAVSLAGSNPQGQQVATVFGARAFAVDPSSATQQIVVAGFDASGDGEITVHPDPTTTATATTPYYYDYTGVAATIDPINRFGYVVDENQIVVLDLLSITGGSTTWYKPFTLTLPLPTNTATSHYETALTWTRAKGTTP